MQQIWRAQLVNVFDGAYLYSSKDFITSYPAYKKNLQRIKNLQNFYVLFISKCTQLDHCIDLKNIFTKHKHSKNIIVILEKYASLKLYIDDFFVHAYFYLYESSSLHCFLSLINATDFTNELHLFLCGKNANTTVKGVYIADNMQNISLKTYQTHMAQDTSSEVIINGVAAENACVKYEGAIYVDQKAVQSRALQKNKNIILGQKASVDARPQMEILNNDVQCTHGCAVGVLDEDQLFYLQTRGYSLEKAKKMVIEGLFGDVMHDLEGSKLKKAWK